MAAENEVVFLKKVTRSLIAGMWGYNIGNFPRGLTVPDGSVQVLGAAEATYDLTRFGTVYSSTFNGIWSPFTEVPGVLHVASLGGGPGGVFAVMTSGTVWQLVQGIQGPQKIPGITTAIAATGNAFDGYALLRDGRVMAWG
jgi:hypothetical protein